MPSFAPRIRVEVYVPIRYEAAYQDTLSWIIREFTELRGGCTVIEDAGGYYLSRQNEIIDDRVSVVYSDFPMDWDDRTARDEPWRTALVLRHFCKRICGKSPFWSPPILCSIHTMINPQSDFSSRRDEADFPLTLRSFRKLTSHGKESRCV